MARGINGTENSNADLCFPSENLSIDSIPIIVDFLDSLGICTGFELSGELHVVPRYHDRLFQLETMRGEHCTKTLLSSECKVFSGKAGFCCSSCAKLRKSVLRECKRANEGQKESAPYQKRAFKPSRASTEMRDIEESEAQCEPESQLLCIAVRSRNVGGVRRRSSRFRYTDEGDRTRHAVG